MLITPFLVHCVHAKQSITKSSVLKHHKCGYEVNIPAGWHGSVEDEADDDTNKIPTLENAFNIVLGSNNIKNCADSYSCQLSAYCFPETETGGFEKMSSEIRKADTSPNASKIRIKDLIINGYKSDIKISVVSKFSTEFSSHVYVYCEAAKVIILFGGRVKYNQTYRNMEDILNKSVSIESLFSKEQLEVINSVKCPTTNPIKKKN